MTGKINGDSKRRPTRTDVAALAGVSSAVVSYVMNNGPRNVAPATRQRVLDAVKELDYRPNDAARNLRSQQNGMVGMVGDSSISSGLNSMTAGVTETLGEKSYLLAVAPTSSESGEEVPLLGLPATRVDGVLFVPSTDERALPSALAGESLPIVAVGEPVSGVPSVFVDPHASGALAAQHLVSLGHTRIALLRRPAVGAKTNQFSNGCEKALAAAGLALDPDLVLDSAAEIDDGMAVVKLVERADPPTALIAQSDLAAFGVLDAMKHLGISVPQGFSMVGVDDLELGQHMTPTLTAVPYRSFDVGRIAAQVLLRLIGGEAVPRQTKVAPQLVVRASTGPL